MKIKPECLQQRVFIFWGAGNELSNIIQLIKKLFILPIPTYSIYRCLATAAVRLAYKPAGDSKSICEVFCQSHSCLTPVNYREEGMIKQRCKYHILSSDTEWQKWLVSEADSCKFWNTKPASPLQKSAGCWSDSGLTSINQAVMTDHPPHAVKQTEQLNCVSLHPQHVCQPIQ